MLREFGSALASRRDWGGGAGAAMRSTGMPNPNAESQVTLLAQARVADELTSLTRLRLGEQCVAMIQGDTVDID